MKPMILARKAADKAKKVVSVIGTTAAVSIARAEIALADNDSGIPFDSSISINTKNMNSSNLINKVAGVLVGVCIIIGIFKVISGTIAYLQAKDDGNGPAESKAIWSIGIGLAFVSASALFKFLFS